MTNQEIYTKVRKHLLTQKERAVAVNGTSCQYRTPGGLTCAVGCLIPKELYTNNIEGASAYDAANGVQIGRAEHFLHAIFVKLGIGPESAELLSRLQTTHDAIPEHHWEEHLNQLAASTNLKIEEA